MIETVAKYVLDGRHNSTVELKDVRQNGYDLEVAFHIHLGNDRKTPLRHETINVWEALGEIIYRNKMDVK